MDGNRSQNNVTTKPGANDQIDRNSYEPAYMQLVNILRRQIASGQFPPGSQIPPESELRTRYQVSPMTVRRAINVLIDQGVVSTTQGKGTFVKPLDIKAFTFDLTGLLRLIGDRGRAVIKLIDIKLVPASEIIAAKLSIDAGDWVVYIRRLILNQNEPVLLHTEYLVYAPTRPIVESEMEVTTLQGLLTGNGQTDFKKGDFSIETTVLNEEESRLLQAPAHFSAFRLEHVFFDYEDRIISWGQFLARGDRLRFAAKVGIWD